MLKKTEPALHFLIGASRYGRIVGDGLHGLTILACWLNALPIVYSLVLSLSVVVSWRFSRRAYIGDTVILHYSATEGWRLSFDGRTFITLEILPSTVVSRWLTVLHFKGVQGKRALLIVNDALPADDYRRLIVALKVFAAGRSR